MFNVDLKFGSFGQDVYRLQRLLERFGFGDFVPTGYFGPKTYNALIALQEKYLLIRLGELGIQSREFLNDIISSNSEILYFTAVGCLGTDASPADIAPDEYGCAETVSDIIEKAFPSSVPFTISTYQLYHSLLRSSQYVRTDVPRRGDIVISPTGYGNGKLSNGHVGIIGMTGQIMSNNSFTGKFDANYTIQSWRERYVSIGAYPMAYFRKT